MYTGIAASKGIVLGKAYVYKKGKLSIDKDTIPPEKIATENEKLNEALKLTKEQLLSIRNKASLELDEDNAEIFDAHMMILEDPTFLEDIKELIEKERIGAAYAVEKIIHKFIVFFSSMENDYLKDRIADIKDVGERLIGNILGVAANSLPDLTEKVVIIAHDLTPSDTSSLDKTHILGFATNVGSKTSHTAIMARSLEIPAVLGLGDILDKVKNDDYVILDGIEGKITVNPDDDQVNMYLEKLKVYNESRINLHKFINLPAVTLDGREVEVAANIGTPRELPAVIKNGGEGIGLYRTEFLYMDRTSLPDEEEQFLSYKEVVQGLNGKPVIIRTLDIGGDKNIPYLDLPEEINPFLGWRAIRICLDRPDIFRTQLRAILRASAFGKVRIMYPMISSVEEVIKANKILDEAKQELTREGIDYDKNIEVGIMVETPAAAITADILIEEVDFFSIGTNDLCQYVLAVDRMNERVSHLYLPFHPAILRLIKNIIDVSHKHGKFTGICGEMAGDPMASIILIGLGINELSMSPSSMLTIKKNIRNISYEQAKEIAEYSLTLSKAEEILNYVKESAASFLRQED
ncbi:MAG: phosphoenolpyruvate--protein phosphotransferase [Bacillota bacterium]